MTGHHRGLKYKLRAGVACTAHFANSFNFLVTCYSFLFHVHTLYGTVLANTAVLCMHVCIVCLQLNGAPW